MPLNAKLREAWEYYDAPRCEHRNAPGLLAARSLSQTVTSVVYRKAEVFLAQPILGVTGSVVGSKRMSDDLLECAARQDK